MLEQSREPSQGSLFNGLVAAVETTYTGIMSGSSGVHWVVRFELRLLTCFLMDCHPFVTVTKQGTESRYKQYLAPSVEMSSYFSLLEFSFLEGFSIRISF